MPRLSLLALLAGCLPSTPEDEVDPVCEGAVPLAACVVPEGASPGEVPAAVDVAGTVVEAGAGAPPEGCVDPELWAGDTTGTLDVAGAWWIRVEDDAGARHTVAVLLPGSAAPEVGDAVAVAWTHAPFEPFAGDWGDRSLVLSDPDDVLLVAHAWAPTVDALAPLPGVALARGATVGECATECYVEAHHAVDVTVDGAAGSVPPGGAADVGGYRVVAGDAWAAEEVECSEQPAGSVGIGVVAI